jgi:3',5'-cyclic AMP phosphodiesterase CpdA
MPARTFVQISDPHFFDATRQADDFWERVRKTLERSPRFSGLLGHDVKALDDLDRAFADLVAQSEESGSARPELIVTGDLTAVGDDGEFAAANGFLRSPATPTRPGLGIDDWRRLAVPGNHDHWPGRLLWFVGPTEGLRRTFPPEEDSGSSVLRWSVRDGGRIGDKRRIVFLLLDGDADVPDVGSFDRVRAIGRCDRAARELQDALLAPEWMDREDQVRVLLLHHSSAYRGKFLQLDDASRDAVADLVHGGKVSVVMTGHIHRALLVLTRSHESSSAHPVLEARCPTTTQRVDTGQLGVALKEVQEPQGFIVHTVDEDGETLVWRAELWSRSLRQGFRPTGSQATLKIPTWQEKE